MNLTENLLHVSMTEKHIVVLVCVFNFYIEQKMLIYKHINWSFNYKTISQNMNK